VIFAASVFDNVRYGRPQASRAEVERACEQAFATEFVARLPQGLDTVLGERGVTLSGGQRQRLSIARALEALERGRTSLVIAHRLATVQHADRILVMDHGRIVAQGTHVELLRAGGLYASLAQLQFLDRGAGARLEKAA